MDWTDGLKPHQCAVEKETKPTGLNMKMNVKPWRWINVRSHHQHIWEMDGAEASSALRGLKVNVGGNGRRSRHQTGKQRFMNMISHTDPRRPGRGSWRNSPQRSLESIRHEGLMDRNEKRSVNFHPAFNPPVFKPLETSRLQGEHPPFNLYLVFTWPPEHILIYLSSNNNRD